ncbi:MAG: DUF1800 family protein, partial [Planctomycetia bacterium]|nr:DUF1800 family protein [Planctomycetia bacterium]
LSWKFLNWFVLETIPIDHPVVAELGEHFCETPAEGDNYNVRELLRKIFKSQFFYDNAHRYRMYKHPMDYMVMAARNIELNDFSYVAKWPLSKMGAPVWTAEMGMQLFGPPNVSGWSYGRAWINSGNLIARFNLANSMSSRDFMTDEYCDGLIAKGYVASEKDTAGIIEFFRARLLQTDLRPEELVALNDLITTVAAAQTGEPGSPYQRQVRGCFHKAGFSSMAYYSTLATTPHWISRSAQAFESSADGHKDRILVILQQEGGNDGLNTVIPYTDDLYRAARPALGVPMGKQLTIDDWNGFHPQLRRLADRYLDKGQVAVVQNVGYVNPNQSHFSSMDYYEFGMVPGETPPSSGWMARYFEKERAGEEKTNPLAITTAGLGQVPDSFKGIAGYTPPAISQTHTYAMRADTDVDARLAAIHAVNSIATPDPDIDFLQRSENQTEASVDDLQTAAAQPTIVPEREYSDDTLGRGLKLVSQIIRAGFSTRIFYVSQTGYDTHGVQVNLRDPLNIGMHPDLLGSFDRSVNAFLTEMELSGNLDRVLVMTFSEFGRRVKENGSGERRGTDHGAANCFFLIGGQVRGGIYGGQPDLADLDKGNVKHKIDFRSLYAKVIEDWLGGQATSVFDAQVYEEVIRPELPQLACIKSETVAALP